MNNIRERKHRLSSALYCGRIVVSFTSCIKDRRQIFNNVEVFHSISMILLDLLNRWDCGAHVYIFMPDHCHLLIQGNSEESDLFRFMKDFKQRSGYWFSNRRLKPAATGLQSSGAATGPQSSGAATGLQSSGAATGLQSSGAATGLQNFGSRNLQVALSQATVSWQKDFYDHILRKDEDINKQAHYILENPVRKGLVDNWKEYPFKGSTIHDLDKW